MKTYKISHEAVSATKFFKTLNHCNQQSVLKKDTMEKIQHGVNICKNRGTDYYIQNNHPRYVIKELVRELCLSDQ